MKSVRSRLPKQTQLQLIELFVLGETARTAAVIVGVQQNTAALFFKKIRMVIFARLKDHTWSLFKNKHDINRQYVDMSRKGYVPTIGIWKEGGKVMSQIIVPVNTNSFAYSITHKVKPELVIYLSEPTPSKVIDISNFWMERCDPSCEEIQRGETGAPYVEGFWVQAKLVLRRYKGIRKNHFFMFLKECEFRFNYGSSDDQIRQLSKWCLSHYLR